MSTLFDFVDDSSEPGQNHDFDWDVFLMVTRDVPFGLDQNKEAELLDSETKLEIIHRDKKCRMCGNAKSEGLVVHHIIPNGPATKNNLITLCYKCHSVVHGLLKRTGRWNGSNGIGYVDNNTRILKPWELEVILGAIQRVQLDQSINLKVALLTGMRYQELQKFQKNPTWFDGKIIVVPPSKTYSHRRWVRLNNRAIDLIPHFFKSRTLPTPQAWGQNLRRWAEKAGVDPSFISPKTTRKTWESWLLSYYPHLTQHILLSQGHTLTTSLKHYSQIGFKKKDIEDMKKWVEGWGWW